jgi:hypothetical protein
VRNVDNALLCFFHNLIGNTFNSQWLPASKFLKVIHPFRLEAEAAFPTGILLLTAMNTAMKLLRMTTRMTTNPVGTVNRL